MKRYLFHTVVGILCGLGFYLGFRESKATAQTAPAPVDPAPTNAASRTAPAKKERVSVEDLFGQLSNAAREQDADLIKHLSQRSLKNLTAAELDQIMALIDNEPDGFLRARMVEAIAAQWAAVDPDAALDYVIERVHKDRSLGSFTKIFQVLAERDAADAYRRYLETAKKVQPAQSLNGGLFEIFAHWRQQSPADAFAAFQEGRIDEAYAHRALYGLCRSENEHERNEIFNTIRGLTDPDLQRDAWASAVYSWAKTTPTEEVVEWLDSETFAPETTAQIERSLAQRKAKDTPREMADWLLSRATEDALPRHLETAVSQWAYTNPNACAEWLHGIEFGPHTDRAVAAFANATIDHDVESAFTWAQTIQDETRRTESLGHVARQWHLRDTERMREAIASSDLDPETRAAILEKATEL